MISVTHRPDNLLQENVKEGVPRGMEGTYIAKVTLPVHKALLGFLNAGVIGQHADRAALEEMLKQWPEYAKARGIKIEGEARDFRRLWVNKDNAIAAAIGCGGDFEIALVQEL
jgi:uncharacterized protein YcsI (UPF0317 family)